MKIKLNEFIYGFLTAVAFNGLLIQKYYSKSTGIGLIVVGGFLIGLSLAIDYYPQITSSKSEDKE